MNPNYMFVGPWQHRELIVLARHLSAFERVITVVQHRAARRGVAALRGADHAAITLQT